VDEDSRVISVASKGGIATLKKTLLDLEAAGVQVENVSLHRPTLDDVFLTLTGHTTSVEGTEAETKGFN
jgi:ABC-2 type transport system ATP-binding protein